MSDHNPILTEFSLIVAFDMASRTTEKKSWEAFGRGQLETLWGLQSSLASPPRSRKHSVQKESKIMRWLMIV